MPRLWIYVLLGVLLAQGCTVLSKVDTLLDSLNSGVRCQIVELRP